MRKNGISLAPTLKIYFKEKDLREHLSRLRIDALIRVVELTKQDISAYAHEVISRPERDHDRDCDCDHENDCTELKIFFSEQ